MTDTSKPNHKMSILKIRNWDEVERGSNFYDFQPGNGGRYYICAVRATGHHSLGDGVLVTWCWRGDTGGGSMFFSKDMEYDATYMMEKTGIKLIGDAVPILVFVRDLFGISVHIHHEFDAATGLHKSRVK